MAFTKAHAKILADMLGEEARQVLLHLVGRGPENLKSVNAEALEELRDLELGRMDIDVLQKRPVFIVSARGKRVAECL